MASNKEHYGMDNEDLIWVCLHCKRWECVNCLCGMKAKEKKRRQAEAKKKREEAEGHGVDR